jgi:hypothetical protein
MGGLVDISSTGARLYLSWKFDVGGTIPLVLRVPDTTDIYQMPCRVVWVRKDEPGNVDAFDPRLHLMHDMVHRGYRPRGMFFGYLYGVRFETSVAKATIRVIQKHLAEETDRHQQGAPISARPSVSI